MPTLPSGRASTAVMALLALAAAPSAPAQQAPRYQVEVSLDQTGADSMYTLVLDTPSGGHEVSQRTRLARVAPGTSLRFGLSLAGKGYAERAVMLTSATRGGFPGYTTGGPATTRRVGVTYLGAPVTLGYNLVNPRRGLTPFVEAGIAPELLVRRDEGLFSFDLRDAGLSYLLSAGIKYSREDGRAVVIAPEARLAASEYSRSAPGELEYRPVTIGIKLGVQF